MKKKEARNNTHIQTKQHQWRRKKHGITTIFRQNFTNESERYMDSHPIQTRLYQWKRRKHGITIIFRQDYTNENEINMEQQSYSDKVTAMKTKGTWNNNHIQTKLFKRKRKKLIHRNIGKMYFENSRSSCVLCIRRKVIFKKKCNWYIIELGNRKPQVLKHDNTNIPWFRLDMPEKVSYGYLRGSAGTVYPSRTPAFTPVCC